MTMIPLQSAAKIYLASNRAVFTAHGIFFLLTKGFLSYSLHFPLATRSNTVNCNSYPYLHNVKEGLKKLDFNFRTL